MAPITRCLLEDRLSRDMTWIFPLGSRTPKPSGGASFYITLAELPRQIRQQADSYIKCLPFCLSSILIHTPTSNLVRRLESLENLESLSYNLHLNIHPAI